MLILSIALITALQILCVSSNGVSPNDKVELLPDVEFENDDLPTLHDQPYENLPNTELNSNTEATASRTKRNAHRPSHLSHTAPPPRSQHSRPQHALKQKHHNHRGKVIQHGKFKIIMKAEKDAPTGCGNRAKNCADFTDYCFNSIISPALKEYCKLECGHCPPPASKCKDRSTSCASWRGKGFCKKPKAANDLPVEEQRFLCAKTCRLCATDSTTKPADCSAAAAKYTSRCIEQTCGGTKAKDDAKCKDWCSKNPEKCKTEEKSKEEKCKEDAAKHTADCLEFTCKDSVEMAKTDCQTFCKSDKGKYTNVCMPTTCADATEKTGQKCVDFCKSDKAVKPPCT